MELNKKDSAQALDRRTSLSERLSRKREQIIWDWSSRIQREKPSSWLLSSEGLTNHVEEVLDRLMSAPSLEENEALRLATRTPTQTSLEPGFEFLILENRVLREVIFEALEEEGRLTIADCNQILSTLDRHLLQRATSLDGHKRGNRLDEWVDLAIRSANLGAWTVDLTRKDQAIVRTGQFDKIVGLRPGTEHFTPHDWTYCVHSEDREGVFEMVDLMMAGKRDFWDVEYRNVCDDKAVRWVKSWGRCIRDSRGVPLRLTGMVADISERKKFELERDRFVHTVVHDIKNPLTAIKLRSDLMRHTAVPPEKVMTFSKVIDSNVQRVLVILQEFVNAEWMRSRQDLKAEFEEFDLRDLIENEVNSLSSSYGEKIQVEVSGNFRGLWSREGLRRAIQNLVDNAFRHGEPGAPVSIVSKRQGEDVLITFHNFGKPIPPEVQKVLFRPFENIEERDERGKRTLGFEFVLVRGVAEAHGGTVSVKSDETTGTTFELRLPIRSASQAETRVLAS